MKGLVEAAESQGRYTVACCFLTPPSHRDPPQQGLPGSLGDLRLGHHSGFLENTLTLAPGPSLPPASAFSLAPCASAPLRGFPSGIHPLNGGVLLTLCLSDMLVSWHTGPQNHVPGADHTPEHPQPLPSRPAALSDFLWP